MVETVRLYINIVATEQAGLYLWTHAINLDWPIITTCARPSLLSDAWEIAGDS
jgi:hypothetical protein